MESTLRTLMEAKERINASSVDERVSGLRDLVAAVNGIQSLPPQDQVSALTDVRRTVDELRQRVEAATAEYEEAYSWLKVLEGVAIGGAKAPGGEADATRSAPAPAPASASTAPAAPRRTDRTVASVPLPDARREDAQ